MVSYPPAPSFEQFQPVQAITHRPRIIALYGSLRANSCSRCLTLEAQRILEAMGAEVRVFDPHDLPPFDSELSDHPKVKELRDLVAWSEGQFWCSPELHGNLSGVFKNQIDWIPLQSGASRPTQGKTLALAQVSGGSQSFNTVNSLRILGRWMRMICIPNQSSVPRSTAEFNDDCTMKHSAYRERLIDVCEELIRFTLLIRPNQRQLADRFSEREETAQMLEQRMGIASITEGR